MRIAELISNRMKQITFNHLSIRHINILRKIKWFLIKPFINDKKAIDKFYHTELEIRILEQLLQEMQKLNSPVVIDIGANIGMYSYYLSRFVIGNSGKCIGFEPRTDIWNRLRKNVRSNNFVAEKLAISNRTGSGDLFLHTSHGLSSLIENPEFEGFRSERVSLTTLDSYVNSKNINSIALIKIDVEGHELEVLEGARETIQKYRPIILCESENRHLILKQKSTEQVVSYISSFNYDTFVISNKHLQIFPVEEINIPRDKTSNSEYYYNYWFIHKNHVTDVVMKIRGILNRLQTAKTS
jgi:FkbM family methyltransferase